MGRRLYVGNLPYKTTDEELNTLFSQAGPVDNVRVMRDMATGRARGFAFVEMGTEEPMIVRQEGKLKVKLGATLQLSPKPGMLHRFDAQGAPIL